MLRSKPSPASMSETEVSSTTAAPVSMYLVRKSRADEPPTTATMTSACRAAATAWEIWLLWVSRMAQPFT